MKKRKKITRLAKYLNAIADFIAEARIQPLVVADKLRENYFMIKPHLFKQNKRPHEPKQGYVFLCDRRRNHEKLFISHHSNKAPPVGRLFLSAEKETFQNILFGVPHHVGNGCNKKDLPVFGKNMGVFPNNFTFPTL